MKIETPPSPPPFTYTTAGNPTVETIAADSVGNTTNSTTASAAVIDSVRGTAKSSSAAAAATGFVESTAKSVSFDAAIACLTDYDTAIAAAANSVGTTARNAADVIDSECTVCLRLASSVPAGWSRGAFRRARAWRAVGRRGHDNCVETLGSR